MKKRLLSMTIALAIISATANIAMPLNIFAENKQNIVVDEIVQESSTTDEMTEMEENEILSDVTSDDYSISLMSAEYTYGSLTYTVSNNQITITDCDTSVTSVDIPAQIDGMNVVAIGNYAFDDCSSLKKLTIPEGVTSLGYYIISGTSISSITLPSTIRSSDYNSSSSAPNGALAGCTTLKEVVFAEGTTTIPNYICASYSSTSKIEKIVIPDSVETIGSYAFYKCVNLEGGINIPKNVKTIGNYAFSGCSKINSVTTNYNDSEVWNGSVATQWSGSISNSAFSDCISLNSVTLVGSITSLGNYVFSGCSSLKALTIPEGVTSLGYYIISGTSISSITLPSTIRSSDYNNSSSTPNGALAGCTTLKEVVFAEGTTTIPNYICASYSQTSYIERVYIPPTVNTIGNYAFYKCDKMTIYCQEGSYAHQYAIDNGITYYLGDFVYGEKKENSYLNKSASIKAVNMSRNGNAYNLLTSKQTFEKDSEESVNITVDVEWGDAPSGRVLISQGADRYIETETNDFGAVIPEKFLNREKQFMLLPLTEMEIQLNQNVYIYR